MLDTKQRWMVSLVWTVPFSSSDCNQPLVGLGSMIDSVYSTCASNKLCIWPGAEPGFRLWGGPNWKKIIWGAKTTNFLKNRGKNYIFSLFFLLFFFFFFGGSPLAKPPQAIVWLRPCIWQWVRQQTVRSPFSMGDTSESIF